jgi:hypothetical protein
MKNLRLKLRLGFCWSFGAAAAPACTKWQVQSAAPQQLLAENRPEKIRITRTDRSRVILQRPEIINDTLYGVRDDSRLRLDREGNPASRHGAREAVALPDVVDVALRKTDPVTTGLLVAAGIGVGVFLVELDNLER